MLRGVFIKTGLIYILDNIDIKLDELFFNKTGHVAVRVRGKYE